jgi:hypothetical protein
MFTHSFQLTLIFFGISVIVLMAVYAIYCRRRANSFINTGRVTDIANWSIKSTITWIITFVLAFVMAAQFVLS